MSIKIAKHFSKLSLQQCDIVGIYSKNNEFAAPLLFGAMLVGLTASPLDPSYDDGSLIHLCSIAKPKIVFCDGRDFQKFERILKACNLKSKIFTIQNHIIGEPSLYEFLDESPDYNNEFDGLRLKKGIQQTIAILPSSGTTGLAKCVCISHEGVLSGVIKSPDITDEIVLNFSSLHWVSGFATAIFCAIMNQTRLVTETPFSPKYFFELIQKYKVSWIFTPPSSVALSLGSPDIKNYDFSSVKLYYLSGGTLSWHLIAGMKKYMKTTAFLNAYTMTETNCRFVAMGESRADGGIGSLGIDSKIKIIDESGRSLGPGEIGEICIYPAVYWPGYYENPKATAEIQDSENWLHSGDLGYISGEGILYLTDRKKDILKYNSFHVTLTEIENIIYELPDVVEVCVCGIPHIVSGHLPTAAVTLKSGSRLTDRDICEHVANRMAHFNHLHGGAYVLDTLPKTTTGKVKRREIALLCEKMKNSVVRLEATEESKPQTIKDLINFYNNKSLVK